MEHDEPMSESPTVDYSSTVDTSRPFTSVKEAVAIFGERILVGEIYSPSLSPTPKPFSFPDTTTTSTTTNTAIATASYYSPSVSIKRESSSWRSIPSSPSPSPISPTKSLSFKEEEKYNNNSETLFDTVKKLEEELEKTKGELKILKERGSETEVALATLNAELHKNMSKLAQAEAEAAGKAASKSVRFENIVERENVHRNKNKSSPQSQTMAHIISLGENDDIFGGKKRNDDNNNNKIRKQKPIVPLVGDLFLFFKRKSSSSTNHHHNNPLYASPF